MSKFLTFSLFTFTFSFTLFAAPSWLAINTGAYGKDTAPSAGSTSYSAYYCTKEAAEQMFGGNSSVAAVTSYIADNFAVAQGVLASYDASLRASSGYVQTFDWDTFSSQYVFVNSFAEPLSGDAFLAIVLYQDGGDSAVRVLGNADLTGGSVTFDSQAGGTVGDWTASSVPEPTGGLLLLLGLAGLALRRRRT